LIPDTLFVPGVQLLETGIKTEVHSEEVTGNQEAGSHFLGEVCTALLEKILTLFFSHFLHSDYQSLTE
jgi:hypothetical protein